MEWRDIDFVLERGPVRRIGFYIDSDSGRYGLEINILDRQGGGPYYKLGQNTTE